MREIRTYGSVGALGVASHPGPPDSEICCSSQLRRLSLPSGLEPGIDLINGELTLGCRPVS